MGAHPAVHIEDLVTIADAHALRVRKPRSELSCGDIYLGDEAPNIQQKLDSVVSEQGIPKPAARGFLGLQQEGRSTALC